MTIFIFNAVFLAINLACLAISFTLLALILFVKNRFDSSKLFFDNEFNQKAEAIILSFEKTGNLVKNQIEIKFQIQVQPEKQRNFIAERVEIISDEVLKSLMPGLKVLVIYKSSNQKSISEIVFQEITYSKA